MTKKKKKNEVWYQNKMFKNYRDRLKKNEIISYMMYNKEIRMVIIYIKKKH